MLRRVLTALTTATTAAALLVGAPGAVAAQGTPTEADAVAPERIGGADRYDTAALVSQRAFPQPFRDGEGRVYLARADVVADALAAGVLTDGPVLLVPPCGTVRSVVSKEVDRLDPAEVVAIGQENAVCDSILEQAANGRATARLGGADRYATAALISQHAFPGGNVAEIYLAGGDSPDAVAGGVLTAGPVLLTRSDQLPEVVAAEIDRLAAPRVVALGGPRSVTEAVLARAGEGRETSRLAGDTRYGTAAAIAAHAFGDTPEHVFLANGVEYIDAVTGGVLTDGPILLVPPDCGHLPADVRDHLARLSGQVTALGGPQAVCDETLRVASAVVHPPREAAITSVTAEQLGASWRPGCPVPVEDLRAVDLAHWGPGNQPRTGRLIVNADVAHDVAGIMADLYAAGFPIERMEPVDHYGADDDASMAANNTSAFNCRSITGGSSWSEHSYGRAIDINPMVNPYVAGATVLPPTGARYVNRAQDSPGMIHAGDEVVRAFAERGWSWGGEWRSPKDYQHFSVSGR